MVVTPLYTSSYKIYISHTDAGGIVYHANHLTFMEHARRDWLAALGFDYFLDEGVHFVVKSATLDYHHSLVLDDVVTVSIDKIHLNGASVIIHQSIFKNAQPKPATTAVITLACIRKTNDKLTACRIPKQLTDTLNQKLQGI